MPTLVEETTNRVVDTVLGIAGYGHIMPRQPVSEWRSLLCRFAWHRWTEWLINYDPPIGELGWTKQRRVCVTCGRTQEASLL